MDATADNSTTRKAEGGIEEFLGILEASFKGRRCYLGQYGPPSPTTAPAANEEEKRATSSPSVGSVVVTLEGREQLVIGAFISTAVGDVWEYWEGEFGAVELEAHRNSLGWDGHSLKTFGDCFVGALDDTAQPSQSQPCAAADATVADEHQQRPPEFSSIGDHATEYSRRMLAEAGRCGRNSCCYSGRWRQRPFVTAQVFGNAQGQAAKVCGERRDVDRRSIFDGGLNSMGQRYTNELLRAWQASNAILRSTTPDVLVGPGPLAEREHRVSCGGLPRTSSLEIRLTKAPSAIFVWWW